MGWRKEDSIKKFGGKYVVFAFYDHYPDGGLHDIKAGFNKLQDAKDWCKKDNNRECHQILNTHTGEWYWDDYRAPA